MRCAQSLGIDLAAHVPHVGSNAARTRGPRGISFPFESCAGKPMCRNTAEGAGRHAMAPDEQPHEDATTSAGNNLAQQMFLAIRCIDFMARSLYA